MRLSPVFMTVVAIAAPLSSSLSAEAQTTKNSKQTAEVFTSTTDREQEVNTSFPAVDVLAGTSEAGTSEALVPILTTPTTVQTSQKSQQKIVDIPAATQGQVVFPTASALKTTPQVSVTDSATSASTKIFQTFQPQANTPPTKHQEHEVSAVFPAASVVKTTSQQVAPTSELPTNTQTYKNPNQTNTVAKLSTNQQTKVNSTSGAASLKTTPRSIGTNWVNQAMLSGAAALKTTPRSIGTTWANQTIAQNPTPAPTPPSETQQSPFQAPTPPAGTQQSPFQVPTPPAGTQQSPFQAPTPPAGTQQSPFQAPTPPAGTQQSPFQAPTPTPNQQNTTPPGTEPALPTTPENQQNQEQTETEPRVLVSEVLVRSQTGQALTPQLEDEVYRAIRTQPGRTTTRSQLQEDINAVFSTGFFSNVQAVPEDTPLGVRVSFIVQPNPVLRDVNIQANPGTGIPSVLDPKVVDEIFRNQYGQILNLRDLQEGIKQLTKRYQDQGYVLAQVIGAPQVTENGVVTLQVAEGVVEDIRVRFRTKEGQETTEKGEPIRGKTQPYIITRELQLRPGTVFNRNIVQRDLQRVFGLGLFEDVNVSLDPGTDPSRVDVVVNVVERNTGSIAAGAGFSTASGLFGTISYQEQNLNGRNQKLGTELQIGQREFLFDVRFTDPWIAGDPYRTSYTINGFRRRSISLIFDGPDQDIETYNPRNPGDDGDRPRILRLGGGVTFSRPLSRNPYERAEWTASAGLQYQRVSSRDRDGDLRRRGRLEDVTVPCEQDPSNCIDLTQSGEGQDDLLLVQLGAVRDRRNNPLQPTSGSFFRLGVDQSVPVGLGSIFMTRLRGSYSQYFPVRFLNFTKGPQTIAFNIQGGTVLGDLPPYEAFTLGGSNSVRGYEEGALGSSRSFAQASLEYRFPVFSVVSGALFFDVGTDFGSETRAGELLDKNGTGYGYGIGVRVQSPLGPIRVDYGINDEGDSRINFGIGERF
ncbi:BamA/TamA family outer membrane protein [Chlorogloeopsis sp. ULAP01]|uniref:BamA/TamA family outer membrane protein n=1 Tax=Chlorogloeopsis sp. ULAP01 TaxID=3056483 RepID=UPI0025AB0F9B|nr:BamA/TamA family outer membrane protein [Chlorogloeopsis sp. ULAP01]MDM9380006.1 BamA/TamA family outer membrane protein [Chlorogloeopsis sp. ULAP01]